jgi:hypothetical protein
MKSVRVLLGLVLLCSMLLPARPARASNPFCGADVWMTPWDRDADAPRASGSTADYAMMLFAGGKRDIAGRVTLITDREAYRVEIPRLPLHVRDAGEDAVSAPFLVRFPTAQPLRYAYVDAVGLDGADVAPCPTYVQPVRPDPQAPHGFAARAATLRPTLLAPLPPLTCAAVYAPPSIKKQLHGDATSHYGDERRTTIVEVFLDSNGLMLKEQLYRSSGVEGLDQTALSDARMTIYNPAEFLCTPVVSTLFYMERYNPGQ